MAEEQDDKEKEVEEEMMRMMEEEISGGDDSEAESDPEAGAEVQEESPAEGDAEADLEADMLAAMQEEGTAPETEGSEGDDLESAMLQAMMDETSAETTEEAQDALEKTQAMLPGQDINVGNISRLMNVHLSIAIELGRTSENISTLLDWSEGSLIELDKVSGEGVDVLINDKYYARGEVVTIAENFGVRLTQILPTVTTGASS